MRAPLLAPLSGQHRGMRPRPDPGTEPGLTAGQATALALVVALGSGCGPSEPDSRGCVAGQSVACVGPEGCRGYQLCSDNGASFGPCICEDAGAGTSGGATLATGGLSNAGGAGPPSGGTRASGGSAAGGRSDATGDGAAGADATGGTPVDCAPADMSDWVAPAYVPARAPENVCTDALIRRYAADCLSSSDCSAFEAGGDYVACGDCLSPTPVRDAEYGPLLLSGVIRETNFAGCIELLGETECAVHQQDKSRCEDEACATNCPVSDADSLDLYRECKEQARSGVCSAYHEAAVCITDPAHVEACGGADFEESLVSIGRVFCGGYASQPSSAD
jgi:hypothetical protein